MEESRYSFGLFPHLYVAAFLFALIGWPFFLVQPWRPEYQHLWQATLAISASSCAAVLFAARQCSSEHFTFRQGLLFIASFMMTGWGALSAVFVFPALLFASALAVVLGVAGLPAGGRQASAVWFQRVVAFFHRHRMVQ
jgi:hypothetical protein